MDRGMTCRFWTGFGAAALGAALVGGFPTDCPGQIGGQIGGIKVLDDVEDLDSNAAGVDRDWVSEWTFTEVALQPITPASASLTLAAGQSPVGVFRLKANNDTAFYFQKTAGVPVPSQLGQSTATHPGDMTSFDTLSFVACVNPTANNMQLQVILECYPQNPDTTFPKLNWYVTPVTGTTFAPVTLDLRTPDLVENANGNTVEQLLSQTRFLAFFLYAGPDLTKTEINLYIDDITLEGDPPPASAGRSWELYE